MRCTCNTAQSSQELGGGGSTLLNFETWLGSDDFKRGMVGEEGSEAAAAAAAVAAAAEGRLGWP